MNNVINNAGLIVLLADATQRHVVIEVAPLGASETELAALADQTSNRVRFQLSIYATLRTQDHPRAVAKARALLRFNKDLCEATGANPA
jgi:hypothetical protein